MSTAERNHGLAVASAVIVDVSALWYLAPLEFSAGQAIGLAWWAAWTITGVVEGLVALTVLLSWCVESALVLAWASAVVGQVHAAAEHAHQGLGRGTVAVAVSVPTIMVGAVYLGVRGVRQMHLRKQRVVAETAARAEAERQKTIEQRRADQAAREAAAAAERAHALELQRLEDERTQAARRAEQEAARLAHEADLERARMAHEAAATAAREARTHELALAELARTQAPEPKVRAPRAPKRAPVVQEAPVRPVRDGEQGDDLAIRRRVREQWEAREAHGRPTPTRALARTLGVGDGAARAQVSRWKAERAKSPEAGVRDHAVSE